MKNEKKDTIVFDDEICITKMLDYLLEKKLKEGSLLNNILNDLYNFMHTMGKSLIREKI